MDQYFLEQKLIFLARVYFAEIVLFLYQRSMLEPACHVIGGEDHFDHPLFVFLWDHFVVFLEKVHQDAAVHSLQRRLVGVVAG